MLWYISKLFIFPSTSWGHEGVFLLLLLSLFLFTCFFFCDTHCEDLVEPPGCKTHKRIIPPILHDWVPLEYLTLSMSILSSEHPQFIYCSSGFPTPALVPMEVFAYTFLLHEVVILCTCLPVSPIFGTVVFPMTSLL